MYLFIDLVIVCLPHWSLNFMKAGTIFILFTIMYPPLGTEPDTWYVLNKYLLNE